MPLFSVDILLQMISLRFRERTLNCKVINKYLILQTLFSTVRNIILIHFQFIV
jgi:hypothetical protein